MKRPKPMYTYQFIPTEDISKGVKDIHFNSF